MPHPTDIQDRRMQDKMQRALEIEIGRTVNAAINGGLNTDRVLAAAENFVTQERRFAEHRKADRRSYG